jgi:uncharacterized protein (TIGR02118 family)
MKLIALYKQPPDPEAFEAAYFGTHLPLLKKVPGLEATQIIRLTRTLMGDGFSMMAIMEFSSESTMKNAMRSPEMAAAGENLNSFAEGLVTLMYGVERDGVS